MLAKGSLTSKTSGEGDIRKALVEARLIDCIVNLPAKLFLNTQIPASLWFLSRASINSATGLFPRKGKEILFIDARNMGFLINRRTRELSEEDIKTIAGTYHNWRASTTLRQAQSTSSAANNYKDVRGFCNSASVERVKELDYVLTPGRYVGLPDDEDDFDFNERFTTLKAEFEEQLKEEERLNKLINENLERIEISS